MVHGRLGFLAPPGGRWAHHLLPYSPGGLSHPRFLTDSLRSGSGFRDAAADRVRSGAPFASLADAAAGLGRSEPNGTNRGGSELYSGPASSPSKPALAGSGRQAAPAGTVGLESPPARLAVAGARWRPAPG